jgi:superkiller protein 3
LLANLTIRTDLFASAMIMYVRINTVNWQIQIRRCESSNLPANLPSNFNLICSDTLLEEHHVSSSLFRSSASSSSLQFLILLQKILTMIYLLTLVNTTYIQPNFTLCGSTVAGVTYSDPTTKTGPRTKRTMSGITVLTPSKLKDQLTSLRESISSLDASSSPISGLAILLTIELATRDVHFALSPSTISDTDVISLLDAVNNTAGKSAIGKDAYPQQLMAALFAAGGMAAASASCPKSDSMSNAVRDACTKTMKRCKDVNDGRFYTLLKLLSTDISDASALMTDIAYASYLYGAGKYALDQMPMWKRCLDCALGGEENHQSCTNPKTIIPLKNMMRIAHAKGNAKRVEELKVWLVCGYIGAVRERMMRDDSARKEETVFEKMSLQQLVGDFFLRQTSLAKIENASIESLLELADESLAACAAPTDDTPDESKLLYFFLQIQLHHLAEEVKIHQEVQQLIRAKKNRWPDKDTKGSTKGGKLSATAKLAAKPESIEVTAADKAEMYNQTQRKVLLEAWNAWYESKQGEFAPSGLRAAINSCSVSCDLLRDCHETLTSQIQRLMKVVLALQQKRNGTKKGKSGVSSDALLACWGQVLAFVSPLMTDYLSGVVAEVYDGHVLEEKESYSREKNAIKQNGIDSFSIELSLRSLLESASQSFVSAGWMCEPLKYESGEMFRAMPQLFSIAHRSLSLCKIARDQHDQSSIQAVQKKSAFSFVDESDAEMAHQQLDLSLQAVEFRMELRDALNTDITVDSVTKIAHKATTSALMSTKSASSPLAQSANAKFGTQFLQLIYAWSGLSINPWPFCNLTQGRTILRNSRESLVHAGKVWGRETQDIMENLLLEIAEADLEGTVVGGNVDNATQKYEQVLYTIEANDYSRCIGSRGMALLKSHCLLGLARVSLMRNTLQSEQYARSALDTLDGLKQDSECTNSTLLCVYAWDDVKWGNFACLYHDSASRQLVAETLIRSSRLDQAESFLLDAVIAAPANFDAAFSLAAFQLRKVLLGDSENIDLDSCKREAKTTLLKCAKMDKNSPLPFALLGLFYELEQDVSRAIGCYRKALSIDPSNAVSGRGLYRLLSLDEMKPFCEAALKQPSHSHGWAWRIIGQLRYSKHGDYDSAIVCFQQALRCRDVNAPDKDVLGVFYADLKTSKTDEEETSNCEVADIWCDLGSCYRDMGKWSGSNRAFEAAREVSRGNLSPNSLVAWAQGEIMSIISLNYLSPCLLI